MSRPNRRERAELIRAAIGPARVVVQCDDCAYVSHATAPATLPPRWEQDVHLGTVRCENCVERHLEVAS